MSVVEAADEASGVTGALTGRYAKALFEYADERSILPEVLSQVRALISLIGESAPLRTFLADRTLDAQQSLKPLEAVLVAQGFGDAVRRFAGVVAKNHRLPQLAEILSAVVALDAARRGEMVAEVRSAQPLSTAQRTALQARLAEAGYSRVSLVERVAPELIGGVVVRIGAKLFDTSIRGRLSRIQNVMKGAA